MGEIILEGIANFGLYGAILLCIVIAVLLIPARHDPAMRLKTRADSGAEGIRLALDGYKLVEGIVHCRACGEVDAKPCESDERVGLTMAQYREKFW